MRFENAICAMRKGYKVQRKSCMNRMNAVRLFMKDGKIYTEQTHELSARKVEELAAINARMIMAEDWVAYKNGGSVIKCE